MPGPLTRRAFLSALAGLGAAGSLLRIPIPARAQVAVFDAGAIAQIIRSVSQGVIQNKIALQNYLEALRIVQLMVFDHQSFLKAAWPDIGQQIHLLTQRWNQTQLLSRSGRDVVTALSEQYPGHFDPDDVLNSTFSNLQEYGIKSLGQWIQVADAEHKTASKALDNVNALQANADEAKSANDAMKTLTHITAAAAGISQAQADATAALVTQNADIANQTKANLAWQDAAQRKFSALMFQQNLTPSALNLPVVTPQEAAASTEKALSVPLLRVPR